MYSRYRIWIESDGGPRIVVEVKDLNDNQKVREFTGSKLRCCPERRAGQVEEWERDKNSKETA